MLRGGYQRAVRAPNIAELFSPQSLGFGAIGTPGAATTAGDPGDIRSSYRAGASAAAVRTLCLAQGLPVAIVDRFKQSSTQVEILGGGNPDLNAEKSDRFTAGFVWSLKFDLTLLRRLNMAVDYYKIELEEVVGQEHVSTEEADLLIYSCDWFWAPQMWLDRGQPLTKPDYIVHPGTVEEISRVLEIANKYKIPVIPWGGGSGTQGGATAIYGGIILDLKRLDKLIEINEENMTVTAQCGINGTQLEWWLNERGLTLPHYPSAANCATLGGYLAPRGSGTISPKYGKASSEARRVGLARRAPWRA
jgi:hypothetical protein